jgi:hypothetical protein
LTNIFWHDTNKKNISRSMLSKPHYLIIPLLSLGFFLLQTETARANCTLVLETFDEILESFDSASATLGGYIRSNIGTSEPILSLTESEKADLLRKVDMGNRKVAFFRAGLFGCFLFLNQNKAPNSCQWAIQSLSQAVNILKNNGFEPLEEIAKSSTSSTASLVSDWYEKNGGLTSDSEGWRGKFTEEVNNYKNYIARC